MTVNRAEIEHWMNSEDFAPWWRSKHTGMAIRVVQWEPLRVLYPHGKRGGVVMKEIDFDPETLWQSYEPSPRS